MSKKEGNEALLKVRTLQKKLKEKLGSEADLICPRCGRSMRSPIEENALSRRIDVYVCPECGTEEAVADYAGVDDSTANWFITHSVDSDVEV